MRISFQFLSHALVWTTVLCAACGGSTMEDAKTPGTSTDGVRAEAQPIPARLHYDFPITAFSADFTRFNSHHDHYGVSVRRNVPESQHYGIRTWHAGFGAESAVILDLETGEVLLTQEDQARPSTPTVTRIAPPAAGGNVAETLSALRTLKSTVEFVATTGHGSGDEPPVPELDAVIAYLNSILLQLDPPAADVLSSRPQEYSLRQGEATSLAIDYRAREDRDLLIDFFVDSTFQSGQRITLRAGEGTVSVPFQVPESTPIGVSAYVSFKLVPPGQRWDAKTAEINLPVRITGGDRFSDVVLTYDRLIPGRDFEVEIWFYATRPRDVRVDLFEEDGTWRAGKQWSSDATTGGYTFAFIPAPADLVPGRAYTLSFKLLPRNGAWSEYLDQRELRVTATAP